jgi:hypothetical protein
MLDSFQTCGDIRRELSFTPKAIGLVKLGPQLSNITGELVSPRLL